MERRRRERRRSDWNTHHFLRPLLALPSAALLIFVAIIVATSLIMSSSSGWRVAAAATAARTGRNLCFRRPTARPSRPSIAAFSTLGRATSATSASAASSPTSRGAASDFALPRQRHDCGMAPARLGPVSSSLNHAYVPSRAFTYPFTATAAMPKSIEDTPLGKSKDGAALLDGLDVYSVPAQSDGHPLAVYGIHSQQQQDDDDDGGDDGGGAEKEEKEGRRSRRRRPILMLHGRTWSSVPVYHLLGGPSNAALNTPGRESRSLMEALYDAGLQPYCMDFRGFGGTPPDASGWVEPHVCVRDTESVLEFIAERHEREGDDASGCDLPALMGWSQGALIAQLVAQKSPSLMSKLILYGSIYDPLVRYPRAPLYVAQPDRRNTTIIKNEFDSAIEDFTVEGSIPPEPARLFAEAALLSDPVKAHWNSLHEFNNCDPARIHVPTLVVAGDQDPYAPLRVQSDLFANLGRGADRTWSIISDADHAVHMLDARHKFVRVVKGFVEN